MSRQWELYQVMEATGGTFFARVIEPVMTGHTRFFAGDYSGESLSRVRPSHSDKTKDRFPFPPCVKVPMETTHAAEGRCSPAKPRIQCL